MAVAFEAISHTRRGSTIWKNKDMPDIPKNKQNRAQCLSGELFNDTNTMPTIASVEHGLPRFARTRAKSGVRGTNVELRLINTYREAA